MERGRDDGYLDSDLLKAFYDKSTAGSRLRRRCRSEDLDRSNPYDELAYRHISSAEANKKIPPNKGFTCSEYLHGCLLPLNGVEVNGDYLMDDQCKRNLRYSPSRSPKFRKNSPTQSILQNSPIPNRIERDDRLPKVEELLEKIEHPDIMDFSMEPLPKQPLKSILNNPIAKSPPPGILKKSKILKSQFDGRQAGEGRRRQRALSESEYISFESQRSAVDAMMGRMPCTLTNMKRAKDNSGSGYSYNNGSFNHKHNGNPKTLASKDWPSLQKDLPVSHHKECLKKDCPNYHKAELNDWSSMQREWPISGCPLKETAVGAVVQNSFNHPSKDISVGMNGQKESPVVQEQRLNILRTTSIGVDAMDIEEVSPPPSLQVVTPLLEQPVSPTAQLKKAVRTVRKGKVKKKVTKKKVEGCDVDAGEPRLLPMSPKCDMETDGHANGKRSPSPIIEGETGDQASVRKLSDKLTNGAVVSKIKKHKEPPLSLPDALAPCVRLSLFPRVPPYLRFVSYDSAQPLKPPAQVQKHLKWKLTTITPIVIKKTLVNSGFKLVKSECDTSECPQEETVDWIGIWGKHMKSLMFRAIKDGQKMNHFPGTFQIGRKDRLWRNLQKLVARHGIKEFGIMPKTYVLPHDLKILKHEWEKYAARNEKWIIKPPASARGTGIKVVSRWTQIPKKRPIVVQRYVSKPYLINGSKFDLRLYVLVTCMHPLRIYLYNDGLARFASVKYSEENASLHDKYMHLTNYSINRLSKNYTANEDAAACQGHKWTLQALLQYLKTDGVNTEYLWENLKDLVIKTIISGEGSISSLTKANITSRYNCYELFGIDVLLDEDLKPWLLEVNISPSLHSASPLDQHVKGPLVTTVLNIAQYQIPSKANLDTAKEKVPSGLPYDPRLYTVYLSKEERDKHIIYTKMEDRDEYLSDILSTLTPDDVRHLIQAEDELTQAHNGMERIFPTVDTHKYLAYLSGPRYYNRLFDAWESKYQRNRKAGIDVLRSLCDIGYHLEVPPVPLKNDVDAPTPPLSVASVVSLDVVATPTESEQSTASTQVLEPIRAECLQSASCGGPIRAECPVAVRA